MAASLFIKSALPAVALLATSGFMTERQMRDENGGAVTAANAATITGVISSHEAALNASNNDAVMALYTEDGVRMPPYGKSGAAAVRQVYEAGFGDMEVPMSNAQARQQIEEVQHHIDTILERLTKDLLVFVGSPTRDKRAAHRKSIDQRLDLLKDLFDRREQLRTQLAN
jgi:hypothetical protein